MQRYARQTILPQIGELGQVRLANSKVLIVGAGGLGHPVAQYLTGMGLGNISILDGDVVQLSNLHRQVLFYESDIGRFKSDVIVERLKYMNKDVKLTSIPEFLDKNLALRIFPNFDVIVDATDNFGTKFLINDVAAFLDKPIVYGALAQFEGQIAVFWKSQGACYRCLYPEVPRVQIANCAESGVMPPLPGIIGTMQALEVMKVLLWKVHDKTLVPIFGRVNYFNFETNENRSFKIPRKPNCPCHSSVWNVDSIVDVSMACADLPPAERLLDVREESEWNEFHVSGSTHWPLSKLEKGELPVIRPGTHFVLICRAGVRAERAMSIFKNQGYREFTFTRRSVYEYQDR